MWPIVGLIIIGHFQAINVTAEVNTKSINRPFPSLFRLFYGSWQQKPEKKRDMNGDGGLFKAVMSRNPKSLQKLLDDRSIVERLSGTGTINDGLMYAIVVHAGHSMMRVMLTKIPTFGSMLNSQGQCSLHLASARGHVEVVKEIVRADVNACSVRDRDGMIPLHLAAIKGRFYVLQVLVRASWVTAFLPTAKGDPILHLCAENKQFEALKMLVNLVKSPEFVNSINSSEFVMSRDSDDNTIFHLLSAKRRPEVIEFLLERKGGLDINALNRSGFTPLDVSLQEAKKGFGSLKTVWVLVGAGAKTARPIWQPVEMVTAPDDYLSSVSNTLKMTVGALFIGVTYQASSNPAGGLWKDDGYHDAPQSSPTKQVYHYAGTSIMASMDPKCFKYYSMFNSTSFYSLVALITVLFTNRHSNYWLSKILTAFLEYLAIATVLGTFALGFSFISSQGGCSNGLVVVRILVVILFLYIITPDNFLVVCIKVIWWFRRKYTSLKTYLRQTEIAENANYSHF